jgi:alkyl hydroperoxide reductase subunit AhpC
MCCTEYTQPVATIGQKLPEFTAKTVTPSTEFAELTSASLCGKWVVIFSYPLDFTFVCPTEIIAFSEAYEQFKAVGCEVIGLSIDSQFTHLQWMSTPRNEGGIGNINYSLIADLGGVIAKKLGFYMCPENHCLRGTVIVDPKGIVRFISMNHPDVGRNIDEVLRLVKGYQFAAKNGEVCPAQWHEGDPTIKPQPNESKEFFSKKY